jgi:predicted lipid carrier protein YhbT
MAQYLSPEWIDLLGQTMGDLPERPGATATVQHVVTGGPDGDVRFVTVVEDGAVASATPGTDAGADITLTTTYADSVEVLQGELDANAAFMQGRIKVTGDMERLLTLLPLTRSADHVAARTALAEGTEL